MKEILEQGLKELGALVQRETEERIGRISLEELKEPMLYAAVGGKWLRGILCLECCRLGCGDPKPALPYAAAVEMVHAYSLAHDDMPCMDNDLLRRGAPSCHAKFGESTALLVGDALQSLAFETALSPCTEISGQAAFLLARKSGPSGMAGGQMLDLSEGGAEQDREHALSRIHSMKTAALIEAACGMGSLAGGVGNNGRAALEEYAWEFGMAFQIADDLLDVTADAQTLGKTPGKDAKEGKLTFVTVYGVDWARKMAKECADKAKESLNALAGDTRFLWELADYAVSRSH